MTTKLLSKTGSIANTKLVESLNKDFEDFELSSKAYFSDDNTDELIIKNSEIYRFEETMRVDPFNFFSQSSRGKALEWLSKIYQAADYRVQKLETKTNFIGAFRQKPQRVYFEKNRIDFKIGVDGDGFLDQIVEWEKRKNGKIKKLKEVLRDFKLVEEIETHRLNGGKLELLVKTNKIEEFNSLTNVGFGVSQFMPIIVADLQLSDDSTLFLAEPETHLHPSVQSKIGDYIVSQVNETEKNYVIETHSEYFLNRIRLAIVKGELKKEDLKVYFLENNGDDTDVYDVDFTKTGAIKNAPKSFFQTYMSDTMDIAFNSFAE